MENQEPDAATAGQSRARRDPTGAKEGSLAARRAHRPPTKHSENDRRALPPPLSSPSSALPSAPPPPPPALSLVHQPQGTIATTPSVA